MANHEGVARQRQYLAAELTRLALAPTLEDVLRRRWLAGTITDERFEQAIEDLADLPPARFPTRGLVRRAFKLRANVTAYDACYVRPRRGARLAAVHGRSPSCACLRTTVHHAADHPCGLIASEGPVLPRFAATLTKGGRHSAPRYDECARF
jgi:hypothetical protein